MQGDNNCSLNNLSKHDYSKETNKPDILRNLTPEDSHCEKNYDKEKIGDVSSTKPLNIPPISTAEIGPDVTEEEEQAAKYVRNRKIKRGLCFVAWVFCLPCVLFGLTRREPADPDDPDHYRDDPCCPCMYDPYYNPRHPTSSTRA